MTVDDTFAQLQRLASVEDELMHRLFRDLQDYAAARDDLDRMMQLQVQLRAERSALLIQAAEVTGRSATIHRLSAFRRPALRVVQ